MYSKSAHLYDLIYSFQDFHGDANRLIALIRDEMPEARTILDVACGSHEHVRTLTKKFKVDGLDINQALLAFAKLKNPKGAYYVADMRNFSLGQSYDVVICLSSSIGYLGSTTELQDAISCFVAHLNNGGLVLVEPWFSPDTWVPGKISMTLGETETCKVARASIRTNEGNRSVVKFQYMVVTKHGIETLEEEHHLTLFTKREMTAAFEQAGLVVRHWEAWSSGRGLYIARST